MTAPYRVAIIGAGIGSQHLAGYQRLAGRFEVTTICDLDRERAQQVAASAGGVAVRTDSAEVLADPDIDIVDICLPPDLHFEYLEAALKAGKHAICEKPLVGCLRDVDAIERLSEATGRTVFPVFQYRFGPAMAQLQALIDAGLAGKPLVASLETHWNRGADYYGVPWRGTWQHENGGAILGHAIHAHDLLCHLFGPVEHLTAFAATRANPIETEDCAAIAFQMRNGALATSSITLGAADNWTRLRFCFSGLTATSGTNPYAPAEDVWTFTARGETAQGDIDAKLAGLPPVLCGYAGLFAGVADALDGKASHGVTLDDARQSLELVSAIYHSARTGTRADLPLGAEHPLYNGWKPTRHG